jgi:hypothetical protein
MNDVEYEEVKYLSCKNHQGVGVRYCEFCMNEEIDKLREEFRAERDRLRRHIFELEHPNNIFNSTQLG